MKVLKAYGTYFDVGYTVGRYLRDCIRYTVDDPSGTFQTLLSPFYASDFGRAACEELLTSTKETFPQYVEEMRGISEGSSTEFIQIFLLNACIEIVLLSKRREYKYGEGCTTFLVHTPDTAVLVHNEDLNPSDNGVWLCANIYPDPVQPKKEAFFAYCLPGSLPGCATAFNMHGQVMTENFLLPKHVNTKGIPRRVLDRAMISASSIDEAIALACKGSGFASGGSNSFAQSVAGKVQMTNVEFFTSEGSTCYDRSDIQENNTDFHFNEYKRAKVDYIPDISTQSRLMRISDIVRDCGKPKTLKDVLHIMGDNAEKNLPIYRTGEAPDTLATAFTVVFNVKDKEMAVYYSNPKTSLPDVIPFSQLQSGHV